MTVIDKIAVNTENFKIKPKWYLKYTVQTCEQFSLDAADGVFQGENERSLRHSQGKLHKASV